jgi:rhamnose transport system permease protein
LPGSARGTCGALSFEFALFILLAAAFTFLLHKTNFGRRTYAIGNNPTGAWFRDQREAP